MGKDFKEKYERVCAIKDRAISLVETQLNGNIENVDAEELGEVADIAKDMAELMKLCSEAEYYHTITEAMEKNSDADNAMYMDKYLPESRTRHYTKPVISQWHMPYLDDEMYDVDGRDMDYPYRNRMYYTEPNMTRNNMNRNDSNMNGQMPESRDYREGRSPMSRKTYMEMKDTNVDKNAKIEEMKKYSHELVDDLSDMIQNASSEEKIALKQILTQFVSKLA